MRLCIVLASFVPCVLGASPARAESPTAVRIGLTAEFGLANSTSAQAVEMGIRVAMLEINAHGGVLGGRPLVLETRDDRSVPGRAIENLKEFVKIPGLVAVFGARFSPVFVEMVPIAQDQHMILLDPWASADAVTHHGYKPNYAFRLSLRDSYAMPALFAEARRRGLRSVGVLAPNTAWGRSNIRAAATYLTTHTDIEIVRTRWYNWGDKSLAGLYRDLLDAGAQAVILVANDREGTILMKEIHTMSAKDRRPILCHWGVTGGRFFEGVADILPSLDFCVVQTFSFVRAKPEMRDHFLAEASTLYPVSRMEDIVSPVGVAHAYDLTHLLALAINKAGSTDRSAIRTAFEHLGPYHGLTADLKRPFTPQNHDALGPEAVFLATYRSDGFLVPLSRSGNPVP